MNAAGQCAFDFIERLDRLPDSDSVMDYAHRIFDRVGFTTLLVCGVPSCRQNIDETVLAMRFPADCFKRYVEQRFIEVDPMVHRIRCSRTPFEWSEVVYDTERMPRAAELKALRADFGFLNAFVVPMYGPPGETAFVAMNRDINDLPVRNKPAIHLMALYLFDRVSRLRVPLPASHAAVTPREREVLSWVAQGKSAWEIGEILHITKRTVDEHAQSAFHKLGAANRTQAVAIALRDRLIEP